MGNQQSSTNLKDNAGAVVEASAIDESKGNKFDVTISKDLAEQIVSEINEQNDSKKAQAEDFAERKKIYEEKLNAWRKWDEARQSQLDSKIDDTSAKLQDLLVEIKYEAELLDKSWKDPKHNVNSACVDVRASLASCLREENGLQCSQMVTAVERCISKQILQ